MITVDANEAVASVAHRTNEVIVICSWRQSTCLPRGQVRQIDDHAAADVDEVGRFLHLPDAGAIG